MRTALYSMLLAIAAVQAAPAFAEPASASPLLGRWEVDTAKLTTPPAERPKSVTITYSDAGAGKWRTNVEVVLPDGKAVQALSTYTPTAPRPRSRAIWRPTWRRCACPSPG